MRYSHRSYLALALVGFACIGCSRSGRSDRTIAVSGDDPEMQAAIATARSKLPEFWQAYRNPAAGDTGFALKVRITDPNGTEHFWLTPIELKSGKIYGTVNNEPEKVKSVEYGQKIEVREDRISDWMYMRSGKMVGNYTIRPLMKTMSKEQVEKLKAIMAEP
jgi:uncharacterized protein YegJ (DUF2314 family)